MNDELRLNYSKRDFTMYRANLIYAPLAQLVEQLTLNQWVLGSSPRWCTKAQPYGKRKAVFLLRFPGTLRTGAPSGTRTARAPRSAYRGAKTPRWGVFRARESPEQSAPKYSLTESVRLFFCCDFPGRCERVHHRGRDCPGGAI